jgi:membrane protease YdiL (CAAX protease family)
MAVLVEGGLVGLAWLGGWLLGSSPLDTFYVDQNDFLLGALAALPMLLLFGVCLLWPVGPLARIRYLTTQYIRPLFASFTYAELALVCLLAGFGEEMLFRGVLQGAMSEQWGDELGLATASALFGLCHAITPTYAVWAGLMGGYLGWLWMVSGNLLVPVVAHALYDFLALVLITRSDLP